MLKIGHRGSPTSAPENTLSAFKKAIEQGADGIELDVHCCKSGELVVIHDDTVERTTNGTGTVAQMTLTQLRALSIGEDEHIPTLEEVLGALGKEARYFIEIKHENAALGVARMIERYRLQGWRHLTMISFRHDALLTARASFASLVTGASFERLTPESVAKAKALGASFMLPHYSALNETYLRNAHLAGLQVIPWTVNEPADIARLHTMGADGIISDYPDRLLPYG